MSYADNEARERIATIKGRLDVHERHCDERHADLREFMARVDRQTERINNRLTAIWRWIVSTLGLVMVSVIGLIGNAFVQALFF